MSESLERGSGGMKPGQDTRVICRGQFHHTDQGPTPFMPIPGPSTHLPLCIVLAPEVQKWGVICLSDGKILRSRAGICPCDLLQCPQGHVTWWGHQPSSHCPGRHISFFFRALVDAHPPTGVPPWPKRTGRRRDSRTVGRVSRPRGLSQEAQ